MIPSLVRERVEGIRRDKQSLGNSGSPGEWPMAAL